MKHFKLLLQSLKFPINQNLMQPDFRLLFSVKVAHTYFQNDICNCLQFTPDEQTAGMLKRFEFSLRNTINGFDLYCNGATKNTDLLDYIKTAGNQDCFKFSIHNTNVNFAFFTELPVNRLWQMDYNSQDPLNSFEGDQTILHLTLTDQKTAPIIGSLKLYFTDVISAAGKNSPVNYWIHLNARTPRWQYYIINKSALPLSNPSISSKNNIVFKGPENVLLENGETALLFYSDVGLPLSEVETYNIDLVNTVTVSTADTFKNKSATSIIIKGLPTPEPSDLGTIVIDGKNQFTSSVYIYL